jgi:hypothetical protein
VPLFIFNPLSTLERTACRALESHLIMKNLNLLLANLLHGGYHLSPPGQRANFAQRRHNYNRTLSHPGLK